MTNKPSATDLPRFDFSVIEGLRPWALFLDIDGTLVEFATSPERVQVPDGLQNMLQRLYDKMDGAMAIVTGRPLESADRLLGPLRLPTAGLHGGEFRFADGSMEHLPTPPLPEEWRQEAKAISASIPEVIYEEKRLGFGLHYRLKPDVEVTLLPVLEKMVAGNPEFTLLRANMAAEIRPAGIDKGTAIKRFMQHDPYAGRHPVFFGDDTTDDDGFKVLRPTGGTSVLVGERRPCDAEFVVANPAAVRSMLAQIADG